MATTTPKEVNEAVLAFCASIVPGGQPVTVPVQFEKGSEYRGCFPNVEARVKAEGGSVQHGWTIWEETGFFLEAEFHAVWVRPDGTYLDVTPHEGETEILFLPDPERKWERMFVPNRRHPLTDDPRLMEFLDLASKADALHQKHARPDGQLATPVADLMPIQMRQFELMGAMGMTVVMPSDEHLADVFKTRPLTAEERKKLAKREKRRRKKSRK